MSVSVKGSWTYTNSSSVSPTLAVTLTGVASGDVLVALIDHGSASRSAPSGVSGAATTWAKIAGAETDTTSVWVGSGTLSSGTITFTSAAPGSANSSGVVYHVGGTDGTVSAVATYGTGTVTGPAQSAGLGQIVIAATFTDNQSGAISATTPSPWSSTANQLVTSTPRYMGYGYNIPTGARVPHSVTAVRSDTSLAYISQIVVGSSTQTPLSTRTNLFRQPSAESGTVPWNVIGGTATVATSTASAKFGTQSFKVSPTATADVTLEAYAGTSGIPVTAGTSYAFSFYGVYGVGARQIRPQIAWYNSSGTLLSTSNLGASAPFLTTSYTQLGGAVTAPANAAYAAPRIIVFSAAAGDYYYLDGFLFEAGVTGVEDYFDGSFATTADYQYAWTGTANESSSTQAKLRRKNLVPNPNFEIADTSAWAVSNATLAVDATKSHSGAQSAKLTASSTTAPTMQRGTTWTDLAALPTSVYFTASAWVYTDASGVSATMAVFNGNAASGTTLALTAGVWTRVYAQGTYSNDTTTTLRGVRLTLSGVAAGTVVWVDDVLHEASHTLDAYFDGSTPSTSSWTYAWTGTASASTSTATPAAPAAPTLSQTYNVALSDTASGTHAHTLATTDSVALSYTAAGTSSKSLAQSYSATLSVTSSGSQARTLAQVYGLALSDTTSGVHSASLTSSYGVGLSVTAASSTHTLSQSYALALGITSDGTVPNRSYLSQTYVLGLYVSVQIPPSLFQTYTLETVYLADFYREVPPTPLEDLPLGKLSEFTVHSSATPLDPSQGTGGVPSVSATFIRGKRPESAMGAQATVRNGAIGTWAGEVTKLSLPVNSERAPVTIDTPLARLNKELRLFPHMPAAAGTTTAAEAVDYWTQTAGVHYDVIGGDVAFYASGYGHAFAYGAGLGSQKFYEQSYTAATVSGRRVLAYGATSLCTVHEVKKGVKQPFVPVTATPHRKIVVGSGFDGTGSGTTEFLFENGHTLALSLSGTTVTVSYNGISLSTATLAAGGWAWASLEKIGTTVWAVRLTADATSAVQLPSIALPAVLRLTGVQHTGDATLYRYGTFLSVMDHHPATAPVPQKDLHETAKAIDFVPGFEGNVWDKLNEFCAVSELDLSFVDEKLTLAPRSNSLSNVMAVKDLSPTFERRDKYKQVAVMDQRSKASRTNDALLWRSDSVYQVAAREVMETTITTKHSILSLSQPVCVNGIEPFPYKTGAGQYVVTGADGYIVSPAWWADNGGKVEVELTDKEGEFLLRITAPSVDTVRAPYRLSEGAGDRPAVYVCGSGIVNDPKEVHVSTGASNARDGFDSVFDSPFCSGPAEVYGTAMAMAAKYSAGYCEYTVDVEGQWNEPTSLGVFPAGAVVSAGNRAVRLMDSEQTKHSVSGSAHAHTTVGMTQNFFPNRLVGQRPVRSIREAEISPLERS